MKKMRKFVLRDTRNKVNVGDILKTMTITIEQARKKLPKEENDKLTDDEVQSIINDVRTIANIAINEHLKDKNVKHKDG